MCKFEVKNKWFSKDFQPRASMKALHFFLSFKELCIRNRNKAVCLTFVFFCLDIFSLYCTFTSHVWANKDSQKKKEREKERKKERKKEKERKRKKAMISTHLKFSLSNRQASQIRQNLVDVLPESNLLSNSFYKVCKITYKKM